MAVAFPIAPATAPPTSIISTSRSSTIASFSQFYLSRSERRFIEDGVLQSLRNDGRSLIDYRQSNVEVGVLPSANGSSRIRTADSELVVGVKCEICHLDSSMNSNKGTVKCGIDCSASLDIDIDDRSGQDASTYLSHLIERLCLNPSVIDRRKLCILPGHFVWNVFVDVVILNGGGNIIDAISLGVKAALLDTLLPSVNHHSDVDQETGAEKVDFDVDPRPEMGHSLPLDEVPICVTVGQIQNRFVWDLSPQEETCSTSRLIVAVDSNGKCRGIHKAGQSPIRLASLHSALQNSRFVGAQIHKNLLEQVSLNHPK